MAMAMAMATEKKKMEDDPSSSSSESDPCEASSSSAADDLISSLPDCVLSHVLSFVPIKESARTSVLSSQWRNVWTLSPLHIDDRSLNHNKQQYPFVLYRRTIIDTILARHRRPIHTFCLSNRLFIGDGTLDRWTETLAQRGVQSLSLFYCPFARRLHTCQSLHSLELVGCDLRGPLALLLPPNLKELKLRQTEITQNSLSHILSSCRALHTLELHVYPYIKNAIHISSPCLRKLTIDDLVRFDDTSAPHLLIEDAPNLELLIFGKYLTEWITTVKVIHAPKLWLLGFVSASLGTIQFGEACFQLERCINFNTRMHSLKTLAIKVNFCDAHQAKVLFGLLRFFPCLENLTILSKDKDSPDPTDTEYWEQEESFDCLDHHLKSVKIKGFYGKHDDLGFARFLIQHAKVLKVISLLCQFYLERKWEETILRQLQFKNRASLDAQVFFMKVHSKSDR